MQIVCAFAAISVPPQAITVPRSAMRSACCAGFGGIAYQRVFEFARTQVCHRPRNAGRQTLRRPHGSLPLERHPASAIRPDRRARRRGSNAQLRRRSLLANHAIRRGLIVKCAVRLYVRHASAARGGNFGERPHLLEIRNRRLLRGGSCNSRRPKFARSGYPGCAPTSSFQRKRLLDRRFHGLGVAGMSAAGDVDRRQRRHQRFLSAVG